MGLQWAKGTPPKKPTGKMLKELYCPKTGQKTLVDMSFPYCGFCNEVHKIGYYVPGKDEKFYQDIGWWYMDSFFQEVEGHEWKQSE